MFLRTEEPEKLARKGHKAGCKTQNLTEGPLEEEVAYICPKTKRLVNFRGVVRTRDEEANVLKRKCIFSHFLES